MDFNFNPEDEAFRMEFRAWLDANKQFAPHMGETTIGMAEGRGEPHIGRTQPPPGCERGLAQCHILAGAPTVRSLSDPRLQANPAIGGDTILLHQYGVGALGHRRAGKNTDRLAAVKGPVERVAGRRAAANRQIGFKIGRQIGMSDRIAVYRTVGVGRQIHRRDDIARQHAAGRHAQRHHLAIHNRDDLRIDPGKRLVDAQQGAAKGKAIVAQLGHRTRPSCRRMKSAIAAGSPSGRHGSASPGSSSSEATATT